LLEPTLSPELHDQRPAQLTDDCAHRARARYTRPRDAGRPPPSRRRTRGTTVQCTAPGLERRATPDGPGANVPRYSGSPPARAPSNPVPARLGGGRPSPLRPCAEPR
jgi:hypothetical protein